MYKVEIYVTLKKDVLDPQGKAIQQAAERVNVKNRNWYGSSGNSKLLS